MLEAEWLWKTFGSFGVGAILAAGVVYLLCTRWLPGYLSKKGENLATKEDIAQITSLVKGVEHQYNVLIEGMKAKQQLRMAALDRRLQAHQEAFTLWRELYASEDGQAGPIILKCQTWWERNCVYLEPEVRKAFVMAYQGYSQRQALIVARAPAQEITEVWKYVTAFPNILLDAVKLPGLTHAEVEAVMPETQT